MTITQVARDAGVRPSTVRYYESIGLLPEPRRVSGRRRYDPDILQRLALIHTAQQAGFTLAEVRVLVGEVLANEASAVQWQDLLQRKLHEVNALLVNVQNMKLLLEDIMDCDGDHLAECIVWTGQKYQKSGAAR